MARNHVHVGGLSYFCPTKADESPRCSMYGLLAYTIPIPTEHLGMRRFFICYEHFSTGFRGHTKRLHPNRGRSESLRVGEDVIGAMTFECHSGNVLPHGCCVFFWRKLPC